MMFWVEEELEAEWETSKTKTHTEQVTYEVEQSAEEALLQAAAPLTLEMAEVRDPASGWKEWRECDGHLVDFNHQNESK